MTTIPILLLKSPPSASTSHLTSPSPSSAPTSPPPSHDPSSPSYSTIFPAPHYKTIYIPPLITTPLFDPLLTFLSSCLSSLSSAPSSTGSNPISALVFTSQRAVSSLASLLFQLSSPSSATSSSSATPFPPPAAASAIIAFLRALRIPIFVVGRATASAVRESLIHGPGPGPGPGSEGWMPFCWVEGEGEKEEEGGEAGTGEVLAGRILRSLRARAGARARMGEGEDEERGGGVSGQMEGRGNMGDGNGNGNGKGSGDEDEGGDGNEDKDKDDNTEKTAQTVIFLTGTTRRAVLPRVLREGGIAVEEIVVYETRVDHDFEAKLKKTVRETEEEEFLDEEALAALRETHQQSSEQEEFFFEDLKKQTSGQAGAGAVRWVVMFSGQGARETLRALGWLDDDDESGKVLPPGAGAGAGEDVEEGEEEKRNGGGGRRRNTFMASIGPTTAEYLKSEFGLHVDVCAAKPNGEALREGIERFMLHASCRKAKRTTPHRTDPKRFPSKDVRASSSVA